MGWCSENTSQKISNIDSIIISIEFNKTDLNNALKQLMEKFKNETQELGVDLKASTFENV